MADFSVFETTKAKVDYMKLKGGKFCINIHVESKRGNETISLFSDKLILLEG